MTTTIKNGYIIFKVTPTFDYDIAIKKVIEEGLEKWIYHLREKRWFSTAVENDFIRLLEDYNGLV